MTSDSNEWSVEEVVGLGVFLVEQTANHKKLSLCTNHENDNNARRCSVEYHVDERSSWMYCEILIVHSN